MVQSPLSNILSAQQKERGILDAETATWRDIVSLEGIEDPAIKARIEAGFDALDPALERQLVSQFVNKVNAIELADGYTQPDPKIQITLNPGKGSAAVHSYSTSEDSTQTDISYRIEIDLEKYDAQSGSYYSRDGNMEPFANLSVAIAHELTHIVDLSVFEMLTLEDTLEKARDNLNTYGDKYLHVTDTIAASAPPDIISDINAYNSIKDDPSYKVLPDTLRERIFDHFSASDPELARLMAPKQEAQADVDGYEAMQENAATHIGNIQSKAVGVPLRSDYYSTAATGQATLEELQEFYHKNQELLEKFPNAPSWQEIEAHYKEVLHDAGKTINDHINPPLLDAPANPDFSKLLANAELPPDTLSQINGGETMPIPPDGMTPMAVASALNNGTTRGID